VSLMLHQSWRTQAWRAQAAASLLARRLLRRAAAFLWMTPLAAARSMAPKAGVASPPLSAFLISVLMRVLTTVLRNRFFASWRKRFLAEAVFGIRSSVSSIFSLCRIEPLAEALVNL
jgi:hypothetical protein